MAEEALVTEPRKLGKKLRESLLNQPALGLDKVDLGDGMVVYIKAIKVERVQVLAKLAGQKGDDAESIDGAKFRGLVAVETVQDESGQKLFEQADVDMFIHCEVGSWLDRIGRAAVERINKAVQAGKG